MKKFATVQPLIIIFIETCKLQQLFM